MIAMLRPEDNFAPSPTSRWLVSTEWLGEHLRDRNVAVVDATWALPTSQRDARTEYRDGHIPGAVFFDIDAIADDSTDLPHMLPGPTQFGAAVGALGIGDGDTVVVYDSAGLYSAPRVWWTFRIFGAKKVYILDGGLPQWKAEGRALEQGDVNRPPRTFNAEMNVGAVAMLADVRMALVDDSAQIVDARSAERFGKLIDNGHLAPRARIEAAFTEAGVDLDKPIITSCGSGITAAILLFALEAIGREPKGLYDGSWSEWGSRPDLAVERG
jgi:thiosulfate/3-mercaptopyruvate sulfurtransferase